MNPAAASLSSPDSALSPSSTGAMDSLLEKLRAAAPQARDQRDRRRRARLKDKHQVRVASGQQMPDIQDLTRKDTDPDDGAEGDQLAQAAEDSQTNGEAATSERMEPISESEDVAERAANMLQGLRGDDDAPSTARPGSRDGKSRRRRESMDEERRNRRRRRAKGTESRGSNEMREEGGEVVINEEDGEEGERTIMPDEGGMEVPTTVVSPPSPEPPRR